MKSWSIECQWVGWLINHELEGICKEVILACFKVLSGHLHGGNQENHRNTICGSFQPTIEPRIP